MKLLVEQLNDLREFYLNQLQVLLSAEEQIAIASQLWIDNATDDELRNALRAHKEETETHKTRLRQLLSAATGEAKHIKCNAAHALVTEAEEMIMDSRNPAVRDVALIAGAQRVEHYEIAAYGALRRFAQIMGETAGAEVLSATLDEEGHADHQLTAIAERINQSAKKAA